MKLALKRALCIIFLLSFSQEAQLRSQVEYDLNPYLHVHEDKTNVKSIETIVDENFIPNTSKIPGQGFSKSTFWVKIDFNSSDIEYEKWVLEINNPFMDSISLYSGDSKKTIGALIPFHKREVKSPTPCFYLNKSDFNTPFYLKLYSSSISNFPITLYEKDHFLVESKNSHTIHGVYIGIMSLFFVFSLVAFFKTKHQQFLFFSLFVINVFLLLLSMKGFGFMYLWPESIQWNYWSTNMLVCSYCVIVLHFSIDILKIKPLFPKTYRFFKSLYFLFAGLAILSFFIDRFYPTILYNVFPHILLIVLIFISFASWKKDNVPALYFGIGWVLFFIFSVPFLLKDFGILPSHFLTENGPFIGSLFEVFFFSFAVGKQVQIMFLEKKEIEYLMINQKRLIAELQHKLEEVNRNIKTKSSKFDLSINNKLITPLSERELEVLNLILEGKLYKEVADTLFVSINTVKKHIKSIYRKLEVNNKIEAGNKLKAFN